MFLVGCCLVTLLRLINEVTVQYNMGILCYIHVLCRHVVIKSILWCYGFGMQQCSALGCRGEV